MKNCINILFACFLLFFGAGIMRGDILVKGISYSDAVMSTDKYNNLAVRIKFDFSSLKVKSNDALTISPMLVNGDESLELKPITVYGRNNWYQSRRAKHFPLAGDDEISIRSSKIPYRYQYYTAVPFETWMDGCHLVIDIETEGCCSSSTLLNSGPLAYFNQKKEEEIKVEESVTLEMKAYEPELRYIKPEVELVKQREITGSAYVEFPVNSTILDPYFRNNYYELQKITAGIDSVKNDIDIDLKAIYIKGFASPEGSYFHNEELAQGRTIALENYVRTLYKFEPGFIHTSFEAENWSGLRDYVMKSQLPNKWDILRIIDNPEIDPDTKNWRIELSYPTAYRYLLDNVYPSLRCTDYRIEYIVAGFDDVRTIELVMKKAPSKLSLNEMFLLARTYQPGSEEFNNIFETAAKMFPDNEIANLNAANAAMSKGEFQRAERLLEKAGTSAEAYYARGMLSSLQGDIVTAIKYLNKAGRMGLDNTDVMIEQLHNMR